MLLARARPGHAFTGMALAQATRGDFTFQNTATFTDVSSCNRPDRHAASTRRLRSDSSSTPEGHFMSTARRCRSIASTGRTAPTFSAAPSHFEFNTNALGQFVSTEVQHDPGVLC